MKKFTERVNEILEAKVDFGKYEDKFALSPSDISEIVTDADDKEKLSPEEQAVIEDELNNLMEKIWKKYKGTSDGADPFWKEAEKIGKKYGLKIKR